MNRHDSRYIKLDGACNFRDVGGFKTENGNEINPGIIFRSDELSQLSKNDLAILDKLKIKLICDLRTPGECKSKYDRVPNSKIKIVNIPFYPHEKNYSQRKFFLSLHYNTHKLDFEKLLREYYFCFAFERTEEIKKIFILLSDRNNLPAVIHCAIGKDRTGFISALIQLIAGASRNDVIDDYLATNEFIEPRVIKMTKFLRLMSLFRMPAERFKPLLEVHAEYLNDVFDRIFLENNTIDEYLIKSCDIPKEIIMNMRKILDSNKVNINK